MVQNLKRLLTWGSYLLLAYVPFGLFISRWLSLYTGGLGQWDASKDILTLLLLTIALAVAVKDKLLSDKVIRWLLIAAAAYGLVHVTFFLLNPRLDGRSLILAILYNGRLLAYLFIGYVVGRLNSRLALRRVLLVILAASTIASLFAVVQYLAPKDLMTHFGYSVERGAKPAFFIDDKPDFPRVMSTVRDPNSYGAYLIVPLTLSWLFLLDRRTRSRLLFAGLVMLHGLALLLTFSRGAWLGAALSLVLATALVYRQTLFRAAKRYWPVLAVALVLITAGTAVFRDNYVFQNVILHSDESTVLDDPNELRLALQRSAVESIADKPLGYGPGTAGLVSIGNPNGTFLPENYYLQIGYEVGVVGLVLLIVMLALVYRQLARAPDSKPRTVLLASFWAYAFIATLIHLWSNEAVSAQWWLLAGFVAANVVTSDKIVGATKEKHG